MSGSVHANKSETDNIKGLDLVWKTRPILCAVLGGPIVHIGKLLPFRVSDLLQDGQRVSTNEVRLDQSRYQFKGPLATPTGVGVIVGFS